jgi:Recombination endonuclease VII
VKTCPRCEEAKPASGYGRNRSRPDGLSFYCLQCNRARNNRWYLEHRQALGKTVRDRSWVPDGFRWCPSCEQAVAVEDYTRNIGTSSGFGSRCRRCANAANSVGYFYRTYKMTQVQLDALRAAQDDRCAICGDAGPAHLDHDHDAGHVRQLLCQRCNHGLGLFRDDPAVLRIAAEYVERHRDRQHPVQPPAGRRPEASNRPESPPVGSSQRPPRGSTATRRTATTSTDSRQETAGEADG